MASENKLPVFVAGFNRSKKLILSGRAALVYLAPDADHSFLESVAALCREYDVPTDMSRTKSELAELCGIEVDCAVCTVVK